MLRKIEVIKKFAPKLLLMLNSKQIRNIQMVLALKSDKFDGSVFVYLQNTIISFEYRESPNYTVSTGTDSKVRTSIVLVELTQ